MKKIEFSRRHFLGMTALTPLAAMIPQETLLAEEAQTAPRFKAAKPVWAAGREEEMNVSLVFVATFGVESDEAAKGAILRVTGSSILRVGGGAISGEEKLDD
ncbi:MAG: hypothetical protein IKT12_05255, partial [Thermoguttaceae bacterium]|nr:hypothetical protein [Thermoguttaceae bacterium]